MAYATRIDDVLLQPGGGVEVRYTEGLVPLPAAWSGLATVYASAEDFKAALDASEIAVAEHLKLLQCAKGYKTDPTLKTAFTTAVKGKTATLDLTGLASTVTVG